MRLFPFKIGYILKELLNISFMVFINIDWRCRRQPGECWSTHHLLTGWVRWRRWWWWWWWYRWNMKCTAWENITQKYIQEQIIVMTTASGGSKILNMYQHQNMNIFCRNDVNMIEHGCKDIIMISQWLTLRKYRSREKVVKRNKKGLTLSRLYVDAQRIAT